MKQIVINLSSKNLTEKEKHVLSKVVNFFIISRNVLKVDILVSIKDIVFPNNIASEHRVQNTFFLEKPLKILQNLTSSGRQIYLNRTKI